MFVFLFWFFIIINVHGKCTIETCVYGQCVDDKCNCDPGVSGETCNMDIIDCDAESCFNTATCIELVNGFACQCLPDFDGSRCQHRRTIDDNHCQKKCSNNGKCIVINNTEKCLCSGKYYGSQCEYIRIDNSLSPIRKCSLLKFRNSLKEPTCLAIGLTPLFDVHCECHYDEDNKHFVNCQLTPSPYSLQKCSFTKKITSSSVFSVVPDPISIHVCPVNWQILDQYENSQETRNNVHITQCQLL